jgi:molybdopterin converting factor small subunit
MAAAVELEKTRALVSALEGENASIKERLGTERRAVALFAELSNTRKSEAEALRTALAAKNETIAAKETAIASQDKLIETLKTKKASPLRRLGDILIGAAAAMILR